MKAFDTDPDIRWLFCMTHPDDEISICAWIRRLTENGNQVFMSWAHSTPERESEGRAVAEILGVPQDHLMFFGAADGVVVNEIPRLLDEYSAWLQIVQANRICCGAFEQGHIDHDATNFIVNSTFKGPVFEIPFYHTYLARAQIINRFADPSSQEVLPLTSEERRLKTHVARQYPSQNIWSILLWYETWQQARLRPVELRKTERMRLQTHKDFRTPNLPPRLAKRVTDCKTWRTWIDVISPYVGAGHTAGSIPVRS